MFNFKVHVLINDRNFDMNISTYRINNKIADFRLFRILKSGVFFPSKFDTEKHRGYTGDNGLQGLLLWARFIPIELYHQVSTVFFFFLIHFPWNCITLSVCILLSLVEQKFYKVF